MNLKLSNKEWSSDNDTLCEETSSYFQSLFAIDSSPTVGFPCKATSSHSLNIVTRPLRQYLHDDCRSSLHVVFEDIMTDLNQWHISCLNSLFPSEAVQHILSIRCPEPTDIDDRCIWKLNPKLSFDGLI
ncbi:hypothetical protein V6N12_045196 [Hibiscus sabdariffa]|uniref:Uncharacterized protein n=1 Tax=Hibiscus sabdariffa TaxID=183260 RepID=A0ABR2G2Y1_9ROSI